MNVVPSIFDLGTCGRTNYPKHQRCQTCRKGRNNGRSGGGRGGAPGGGRNSQKKEIDWAVNTFKETLKEIEKNQIHQ